MTKEKNITIDDLAEMIKVGFEASDKRADAKFEASDKRADAKFEASDKRTDAKIDGLAMMVQHGFEEMDDKFGKRFTKLENNMDEMNQRMERVELRLCNIAYRFELVELQGRVKILEEKLGIESKK